MKTIRSFSLMTVLLGAVALSGCGSTGVGDILGGGQPSSNDPYRSSSLDVRGTVERVNTLDRTIIVDAENSSYNHLRNGNGDEVVLHYDDSTVVEFEGRTYRPEDLESGDRIAANVERTSSNRLLAEQIDVLYDATRSSGTAGRYDDRDRYDDRATDRLSEVRGVVRYVDTRNRTVDIEPRASSGRSDERVTVYYDTATTVEFNGRQYRPENLERGDEVEIEVRTLNGRMMAQEILVVGEARSR